MQERPGCRRAPAGLRAKKRAARNAKQAVIANAEWEGANAAMLQERFTQWMAG
jgi:hypothetical protein